MRATTWKPTWKLATFDHRRFAAAINARRTSLGLEWKQIAEETGVAASTLSRMPQGKYPELNGTASLAAWAGLSMDDFVRVDLSNQGGLSGQEEAAKLLRLKSYVCEAGTLEDFLARLEGVCADEVEKRAEADDE